MSPAARTLLGKPPEKLLGDLAAWLTHVDPRDHEVVLAALAQLGRQSQPVVCEYRVAVPPVQIRHLPDDQRTARCPELSSVANAESSETSEFADSKVIAHHLFRPHDRWVRDMMVPDVGPDGTLLGWQGVLTDITQQRALADDLRGTTSMFHALLANLPAGVFFVQAESGRPILVNARARQLLGQREDLAASLEHLSIVYRLYRHDGTPYPVEELPVLTALRRGATCIRDDIVVHRPDGRRIPLVSWAAPVDIIRAGTARGRGMGPRGFEQRPQDP